MHGKEKDAHTDPYKNESKYSRPVDGFRKSKHAQEELNRRADELQQAYSRKFDVLDGDCVQQQRRDRKESTAQK